jgi:hypothetical protein
MKACAMTITLTPTVIAGDRLADDYVVRDDGRDIGRIRKTTLSNNREVWDWMINIPLPIPAWCHGSKPKLDEAKDAFKAACGKFRASLTDHNAKHWHHHDDASDERLAAYARREPISTPTIDGKPADRYRRCECGAAFDMRDPAEVQMHGPHVTTARLAHPAFRRNHPFMGQRHCCHQHRCRRCRCRSCRPGTAASATRATLRAPLASVAPLARIPPLSGTVCTARRARVISSLLAFGGRGRAWILSMNGCRHKNSLQRLLLS